MVLSSRTDTGADMWICPGCGRRMLLGGPPHYERLVLEHGDESAVHVGGKGGLRVGNAAIIPLAPEDVRSDEREWLRGHSIDWDGTPA